MEPMQGLQAVPLFAIASFPSLAPSRPVDPPWGRSRLPFDCWPLALSAPFLLHAREVMELTDGRRMTSSLSA